MFVKFNTKLVNTDTIATVTYDDVATYHTVHVHYKNGDTETVAGLDATYLLLQLNPAALEGQALKFEKNAWAFHNLIAHPLMQIFSWLGFIGLALRIHDATIPAPINK